jgi:hypothetical protein
MVYNFNLLCILVAHLFQLQKESGTMVTLDKNHFLSTSKVKYYILLHNFLNLFFGEKGELRILHAHPLS